MIRQPQAMLDSEVDLLLGEIMLLILDYPSMTVEVYLART
jgi:hypothetical protein